MRFHITKFQANFSAWWLRYLLCNSPYMNFTVFYWWQVNIGSSNGLVPSGNKPLPESMLTQLDLSRHMASLGHNVLTWFNLNFSSKMIHYSKGTYYNINLQFKEYVNGKQHWNVSLYKHILNTHILSCLETLLWRVYTCYGFNITIIIFVNVKWCGSNISFSFIKAIWNNFHKWLKTVNSNRLYIHIAIQLINNLAITWIGDPIIEKNSVLVWYTLINIWRTTMLLASIWIYYIYNNEIIKKMWKKTAMDTWIDKVMVIRMSFV